MSLAMINRIDPDSPAEKAGVSLGERVISINGKTIVDVLDFKFYSYEREISIELAKGEETRNLTLQKEEGEDLGLGFETYLMDKARSCANDCIFCFVDQMPPNMRETLYFKDDDARLSFLTGNYITLTNLSQREIQRIIDLRISPINISVHATNPELRSKMLKHPKAGNCLEIMEKFAKGKIQMNCQIVSCPDWNDGEELRRSLLDLSKLYPQVNSVSVVPVGLTKYRENLPEIKPYDRDTARAVLDLVEGFAQQHLAQYGTSFAWCSDEFYLLGERELPPDAYFEDYSQWENGVGMLSLFRTEFLLGMKMLEKTDKADDFTIATGTASATLLKELVSLVIDRESESGNSISAQVIPILNDFFGHTVTVVGLLTGRDLIAQLQEKKRQGERLAPRLLVSQSMLRHGEKVFLDDVTTEEVERALGVALIAVPQDGNSLVEAIYGLMDVPEIGEEFPVISQEAHDYNIN
ncbi:MAG: DUF512 domain-containing protein [Eubacteriales bacterium]